MRNFDANISAEINKENFTYFFMIELQLASTYRFNDSDVPIYNSGNLFSPRSFNFGDLRGSTSLAVENIDVEIDDADQVIGSVILNEDARNKTAILYFGVIDSGSTVRSREIIRGIIGGWEMYDDSTVKITITNDLVLWNKKCLRPQSSSCPWAFKGTECAYSGSETWCDQSYDRCSILSNTAYFGGDRFMPALVEKEIWWGRTRG